MATRRYTKEDQREAETWLKDVLKPGDTVYTILRHYSKSGMRRSISLVIVKDSKPYEMSFWAARACDWRIDQDRGGISVGGCGMDMGFHLVYSLSSFLFPEGFTCIGEGCPSNDHINCLVPPEGTCRDHIERKSGVCHDKNCKPWNHDSGGYALRHRWL